MKAKIIGAGSIGNHLAQAARRMGWEVDVVDRDPAALERMKNEIYPERYGAWDGAIRLFAAGTEPKGGYDLIFLGTPPDVRMKLAIQALEERPRILQLEKPLCGPELEGLEEFLKAYRAQSQTIAVMGYDHAISESINDVMERVKSGVLGDIETVDVDFRSHWKGIFKAHPWLTGPQDTYLGFWKRGGGASGEHSHGLHLWIILAKAVGLGQAVSAAAFMDMRNANGADYDALCALLIQTDKGRVGRVVQDVVTLPSRKYAKLQGSKASIEWFCNKEDDKVVVTATDGKKEEKLFPKQRPDEFYREMRHLAGLMDGEIRPQDSPISVESGAAVMRILHQAHAHRNAGFKLA